MATWAAAILAAGVVLYVLKDVLLPFVAGFLVAYMADPLVRRLTRIGLGRAVASMIAILLFFLAATGLMLMTVPILRTQIVTFAQRLPSYIERARALIEPMLETLHTRFGLTSLDDLSKLASSQASEALGWIATLLASLVTGGAAIVNIISLMFITPLVAYYLLRDWPKVMERLDHWLPRAEAGTIRGQLLEIDRTLDGFVRGQATVCLVLAIFYAVGLASQARGSQQIDQIKGLTASHPALGWALVAGTVAISGLPPFGLFMSEFLLVTSTFPRSPILGVLLLLGLLIAFGGLMLRLHGIAFGEADGDRRPLTGSLLPVYAHLILILIAGIFLPGPLVAWFQSVAEMVG